METKEYYSKDMIQWEIKAGNRTGTVEQMDANVEAMARNLQEILRIGAEQKKLWEVYEGDKLNNSRTCVRFIIVL